MLSVIFHTYKTKCEILLPLRLLETQCKSSIFVLLALLLLQEDKSRIQLVHPPHNSRADDCQGW